MPDDGRNAANEELDPPFLDPDPPPWAARGLASLLLALFLVTVTSAAVVTVPETVSGPFTLVAPQGANPVRAPRTGIVREVRAADGSAVGAQAPLFVIESEPVGDRSVTLGALRAQLRGSGDELASIDAQRAAAARADEAELRRLTGRIASLERAIELRRGQLELVRTLAERYRTGVAAGAVSATESARAEMDAHRLAEELETASGDRDAAREELEERRQDARRRNAELADRRRRIEAAREEGAIRITALERELAASAGSQLTVLAPCAGTVLRAIVNTPGTLVREGDVLADVACAGTQLEGDLLLPQTGVALVREGQLVRLRYDAFPYQRHGVRFGRVRWVGPSAVGPVAGSGFRALVTLEDTVRVRGRAIPVMPGMAGRADVVVGRRTMITYAFEPLRQLRESVREGPRDVARPAP